MKSLDSKRLILKRQAEAVLITASAFLFGEIVVPNFYLPTGYSASFAQNIRLSVSLPTPTVSKMLIRSQFNMTYVYTILTY